MIGGGIKDELLCQMTADACGKTVVAGPVEATVTGNIVVQMLSFGMIKDEAEAKDVIINSTNIKTFTPNGTDEWKKHFETFKKYQ